MVNFHRLQIEVVEEAINYIAHLQQTLTNYHQGRPEILSNYLFLYYGLFAATSWFEGSDFAAFRFYQYLAIFSEIAKPIESELVFCSCP